MKKAWIILRDAVVFIACIAFVYGVYHRFWLPATWFLPSVRP